MDLSDYKVLPGVVIDVNDPKHIGRVKADSPGLFNSNEMNKEGMPWIYPLTMSGYQRFSKLINGSKIWIITNKEQYTEFWYIPMFQLNDDSKDIICKEESDYDNSEILLSRNLGDNSVYIYYSPSKGIMLQNSKNTYINLDSDNKIEIKAGDANITLKDNKVFAGNGDNLDINNCKPAVKSPELTDVLKSIKNTFTLLKPLISNPYSLPSTTAVITAFENEFDILIDKIKSNNVHIN